MSHNLRKQKRRSHESRRGREGQKITKESPKPGAVYQPVPNNVDRSYGQGEPDLRNSMVTLWMEHLFHFLHRAGPLQGWVQASPELCLLPPPASPTHSLKETVLHKILNNNLGFSSHQVLNHWQCLFIPGN